MHSQAFKLLLVLALLFAIPVCANGQTTEILEINISPDVAGDPISPEEFAEEFVTRLDAGLTFISGFGLVCILLFALYQLGKRISARYEYLEKNVLRLSLILWYILFGALTLLISLPLLTISGMSDQVVIHSDMLLLTLFIVIFLSLSSAALLYSLFNEKPVVLIHISHILITLVVLLIFIAYEKSNGVEMIPLYGLMMIPVVFPLLHTRMLRRKACPQVCDTIIPDGQTTIIDDQTGSAPCTSNITRFPTELSARYMDAEYSGKGGTALVFRATRRSDNETVAVKVPICPDEAIGRHFMREMKIWESLVHRNIVTVYSVNILPTPFVEMEYISESLNMLPKPLKPEEALRIVLGVASGLKYAHEQGIVHRDIKPQNILITGEGVPKITDWGLGRILDDRNETNTLVFSLNYASPEQIAPGRYGRGDARTDIFQLVVVFYELLTGRLPFSGEGVGEYSAAILNSEPVPPSEISGDLRQYDRIVLRCLNKDKDERYQSVDDLIADLRDISSLQSGSESATQ